MSSYANHSSGSNFVVERRPKPGRRKLLIEALRWIASDERGRTYLADLVRESGALQRVVGAEAQTVMFLDGQRSIGFKVMNDVRALDDAAAFTAVVTEAMKGDGDGDE
jgi:hypothetical protein